MSKNTRGLLLKAMAVVVSAASIFSIYQVAASARACGNLLCQLRYAGSHASAFGLPLSIFVLLGVMVILLVLALFQLSPARQRTLGRACVLIVCMAGLVLMLRIAAIETIALHAWSWSCVAASWLSSLLLGAGIFLAAKGYPTTRLHSVSLAVGAILVAGLSWYLVQASGIARVQKQEADRRLLSPEQSHGLGPVNAPLQIVEFADFRCPPCRRFAPDLRKLITKYDGKARLVLRELPNEQLHPQAERAAEIAECFGEQGKFWEAATELYQSSVPDDTQLAAWGARLGVANPQLTTCMAQHRGLVAVVRDRRDAIALGVSHTPTLFIGSTMVEGATSFDKLEGLMRYEMAGHPQTSEAASNSTAPVDGGCAVQSPGNSDNQKKSRDTGCH